MHTGWLGVFLGAAATGLGYGVWTYGMQYGNMTLLARILHEPQKTRLIVKIACMAMAERIIRRKFAKNSEHEQLFAKHPLFHSLFRRSSISRSLKTLS